MENGCFPAHVVFSGTAGRPQTLLSVIVRRGQCALTNRVALVALGYWAKLVRH